MKNKFVSEKCPVCESGELQPKSDGVHLFRHGRKEHRVTGLHYAICNNCGTRAYLHGQLKINNHLIQEYQKGLLGYVSPSDVLAVREKYLLTQKQANTIFGGGSQGFTKWERGVASPAGPTARLIKLALQYPEVMRGLARESGVQLVEPIPSFKPQHVFVVTQAYTNSIDEFFATNETFIEAEQDEYLWLTEAKKRHPKPSPCLN